MTERRLSITTLDKVTVLSSILHEPNLGLSDGEYSSLLNHITHIIHCAWPVNFQLGISSFESSLRGLRNLLDLSLCVSSPRPARLVFCSSIAVALGIPVPALIPEKPMEDLSDVSNTGYAQSKIVGEKIVEAAAQTAGADASIYRIGQIVGDTTYGIWNDSEAFPLIIRSARTMGVLPELNMDCEWLPVDTCAKSIIEIEGLNGVKENILDKEVDVAQEPHARVMDIASNKILVYHIRSPHTFSWTKDLLPALATAGLSFKPVPLAEWLQQLHALSAHISQINKDEPEYGGIQVTRRGRAQEAAADPEQNPALKLIEFFEEDLKPSSDEGGGRAVFDIKSALEASPALRAAEHVIESRLLGKMVRVWMEK